MAAALHVGATTVATAWTLLRHHRLIRSDGRNGTYVRNLGASVSPGPAPAAANEDAGVARLDLVAPSRRMCTRRGRSSPRPWPLRADSRTRWRRSSRSSSHRVTGCSSSRRARPRPSLCSRRTGRRSCVSRATPRG
ncbi:hypothetical protein [Mumia zhuanghuii]|uniref:hypothetical protein n=1 Tax=Mumia zhuanghuii TaxID=2585211 RepID=UPI0036384B2F